MQNSKSNVTKPLTQKLYRFKVSVTKEVAMSIKKQGSKFVVTNKAGTKTLGTHPTRGAALSQLRAIEASKKKGK